VRQKAKAEGAAVMIFGGEKGEGFSIQATPENHLATAANVAIHRGRN
jgi:hypothetical protein